jgi:hypothetical protein
MVTGAFIFSGNGIDVTSPRQVFEGMANQNMVDAQAAFAPESKITVVPPAEALGGLFK